MTSIDPTNAQQLQHIAGILANTMSADAATRDAAVAAVKQFQDSVDTTSGFVLALLTISSQPNADAAIPHSACVNFKNVVKACWDPNNSEHCLMDSDKAAVRANIFQWMLTSGKMLRKTLAEAVLLICKVDFPNAWPEILDMIVGQMTQVTGGVTEANVDTLAGTMSTAHSLFQRYAVADELTEELKAELLHINEKVTMPLIHVLTSAMTALQAAAQAQNVALGNQLMDLLVFSFQTLQDLTHLDLGQQHVDNLSSIMGVFHSALQFTFPAAKSRYGEDKVLELRSTALDVVTFYLERFDELIEQHIGAFANVVWEILKAHETTPDALIIASLAFLEKLCRGVYYTLLANEEMLKTLCESVVLPNLCLKDDEVELFNDEPNEYVQQDIEGSDFHTRRRSTCDLIRALMIHFEAQVGQIFQQYCNTLLQEHRTSHNWRAKDAAIYLVTALAVKGSTNVQRGTTGELSSLVPIGDFFNLEILPELQATDIANGSHEILKADAIRFVATFRNHIPAQVYPSLLASLASWVQSKQPVVHTYAAHALERLMTVKDPSASNPNEKVDRVTSEMFSPCAEAVLGALCYKLQSSLIPNEYTAAALVQVMKTSPEPSKPFVGNIGACLGQVLLNAAKNPINPLFNHHLFEATAWCVKLAPELAPQMEATLWPTITEVLSKDITEFLPYILQILAQLVDAYAGKEVPAHLVELYEPLLNPKMYENRGAVPAIVRLLVSLATNAPQQIVAKKLLEKTLGVFQFLVNQKTLDHEGFNLITASIASFPEAAISPLLRPIFDVLFKRLQTGKTNKYIKCLTMFVCSFIVIKGPAVYMAVMESIQADMFSRLLENQLLPFISKVKGTTERKLCAVGLTTLCSDGTVYTKYTSTWVKCVEAAISVIWGEQQKEADAGAFLLKELGIADLRSAGGDVGVGETLSSCYVPLKAAEKPPMDLCANVAQSDQHFLAAMQPILSNAAAAQTLRTSLNPQFHRFINLN